MLRLSERRSRWYIGAAVSLALFFLYLVNLTHRSQFAQHYKDSASPDMKISEFEIVQNDGAHRYTRIEEDAHPDLLWLAVTCDKKSWGKQDGSWQRTFKDFLDIVTSQYDVRRTALGLLTSSPGEYATYKSILQRYEFPKIDIFLHKGFYDGPGIDRHHRHDEEVQKFRRAEIAKLRNYLMLKALRDEEHVIWLDADIYHVDDGLVRRMVTHIQSRDDVGILTARCGTKGLDNYDLNAWRGTRQGPRGWDLDTEEIDMGEMAFQGQHHVSELIRDTSDDDLLALDTVGATVLYIRASLIWRGLNFPQQYVVGTQWGKDGWDGIESEGLCYRARGLKGGKCMVLGGKWHTLHTIG